MPAEHRRIVVRKTDVLVVNGVELDGEVLRSIVDPERRMLWSFAKRENGDVIPTCFSEEQCIWLTEGDLARSANDV